MKIGVVVDNEFDSDHRVQKQVRQLIGANHEVYVLCFDFGNTYKKYASIKVKRISINQTLKNGLVLLSTQLPIYEKLWSKNISTFINTYKLEAIHCHDLYMSKASRIGIDKSNYQIKLTVDLHENYPAAINTYNWATKGWRKYIVKPEKWYKLEFEYLNYADSIITLSNWFSKNIVNRFPNLKKKNFVTHPNLLDLKSFQEFSSQNIKVKLPNKFPTLIYFGVVAQRRGILELMEWLDILLTQNLKFHLLIIGPIDKADENQFNNLLQRTNLSKNSTYIKWADISSLPAYLQVSDIGLAPFEVNPQHDSGVANKLYQYMFGAIPILATACKAQKELIQESNCGLIYTDFNSFKKYLIKLLNNENIRERLGNNGYKKLHQLYKNKVDEDFLKLYN